MHHLYPLGEIPEDRHLRLPAVLADIIYLWAIQYYGNPAIDDRFDHLDHIFAIISELDPALRGPLRGRRPDRRRGRPGRPGRCHPRPGAAKNPGQWIFPFEAGHYAQLSLKDYALAKEYYEKTMEIPGAPEIAERL